MKEALADLLGSKKFLVGMSSAVAAILIRLSVKLNIGMDVETANQVAMIIVTLAGLYLGSQGAADFGKHAAVAPSPAPAPAPAPAPTPEAPKP